MTLPCPACGQRADGDTLADGRPRQPTPGDVSICFYCAAVLEYLADLSLVVSIDPRKIGDRTVQKIRRAMRADIRRRRDALN